MNPIKSIIDGLFQSRPPQDDEYINEADGLIYCSKCHTPRQCRVQYGETDVTPRTMCRCQREEYETEQAESQKRQHLMRIQRLKASGLQDRYLHDYTFANDKGYNPAEIRIARRYVSEWNMMKANCTGLLLWGEVGTGKSFIAACIANALIEKGVPVLMTNFSKILNTLTGLFNENRNRFIESFDEYSLLIIDDLGIECSSAFAMEQVFNIIDGRYRCKKPMIVTTNLTMDELKHANLAHARIYDRILERCTPLMVNNINIRQLNAAAQLRETRKLLTTIQEEM